MKIYKKSWMKFDPKLLLGFFVCFFVRLLPFRAPNIEPLMTTIMPFSKVYGVSASFLFAFLSIVFYDVVTGTLGKWTLLTSVSYGVVALASAYYFKTREVSRKNFVIFAIIGTIFFDAVTGLLTGPLFFHQSFYIAFVGQVPFTLLHLVGNISFAFVLSPVIYSFVIKKTKLKKIDTLLVTNILNPKII